MGKGVRFLNPHLRWAEISFVGSLLELVWSAQNAEAWGLEVGLCPCCPAWPYWAAGADVVSAAHAQAS